jgi:hypothetical protein
MLSSGGGAPFGQENETPHCVRTSLIVLSQMRQMTRAAIIVVSMACVSLAACGKREDNDAMFGKRSRTNA